MKPPFRSLIPLILLTLVAGAIGGWFGVVYGERAIHPPNDLHTIIHRDLDLTSAQDERIVALEQQYASRRKTLEAEMRAANRDLANALDAEHKFGPSAQTAIGRFHRAEKEFQEVTIKHVLAMRAVLNAVQSRKFDKTIHETLVTGPS